MHSSSINLTVALGRSEALLSSNTYLCIINKGTSLYMESIQSKIVSKKIVQYFIFDHFKNISDSRTFFMWSKFSISFCTIFLFLYILFISHPSLFNSSFKFSILSNFQLCPIFHFINFISFCVVQSYNFKQFPMLSYDWNLTNFRNLISYIFWIFIIFRRTSIWQKMPKKHKNQFYSHLVSKFIHFIVHIRSTHILMMVQVHTRWGTFDA